MISIVIPVYNTEKYLQRCIDSILIQTYKDFEAIFVDDGSSDNSWLILAEYQQKDTRVRVFHQENQGVTKARAFGVSQATGEWITFVDSDDSLPSNALMLYAKEVDERTDIIHGWILNTRPIDTIISVEEYRSRCISRSNVFIGPVAHLFRRKLFTDSVFEISREVVNEEDMLMNIRLAFQTEKPIKFLHHLIYNYYPDRPGNVTTTFKDSVDYEYILHQQRLKSIPLNQHQLYMKEMVGARLYSLLRIINSHPFDRKWKKTLFYTDLTIDFQKCNYKTTKANYAILTSPNVLVQLLFLMYKRMACVYLRYIEKHVK